MNESLTGLERHFFFWWTIHFNILPQLPRWRSFRENASYARTKSQQYFIFILFFYLWEAFEGLINLLQSSSCNKLQEYSFFGAMTKQLASMLKTHWTMLK